LPDDVPWPQRIADVLETGRGLVMHFQPIVDLGSRQVRGYEALARFRSPRLELERLRAEAPEALDSGGLGVGPHLWFSNAALLGVTTLARLETLAATLALAHLSAIPDGCYVSVNCAPSTATYGPMLAELARHPLDRVVLELTEHDTVEDYGPLLTAVGPLRKAGHSVCLRLAVDDVGAGASMRHLMALNADLVKLDLSLIRGINADRGRRALVRGFSSFATATGAVCVAEGVETEAERATLIALDVPAGQGYLFGRPGPLPVKEAA
jgi:EAL domain-containing protein (putative c-di-GMP-specific phosphodiesterase class I)